MMKNDVLKDLLGFVQTPLGCDVEMIKLKKQMEAIRLNWLKEQNYSTESIAVPAAQTQFYGMIDISSVSEVISGWQHKPGACLGVNGLTNTYTGQMAVKEAATMEEEEVVIVDESDDDLVFIDKIESNPWKHNVSGRRIEGKSKAKKQKRNRFIMSSNSLEYATSDYIEEWALPRGQATDYHRLAERSRRDRIKRKMKSLGEVIPGCGRKGIDKAKILDEVIRYVGRLKSHVQEMSLNVYPRSVVACNTKDLSVKEVPAFVPILSSAPTSSANANYPYLNINQTQAVTRSCQVDKQTRFRQTVPEGTTNSPLPIPDQLQSLSTLDDIGHDLLRLVNQGIRRG